MVESLNVLKPEDTPLKYHHMIAVFPLDVAPGTTVPLDDSNREAVASYIQRLKRHRNAMLRDPLPIDWSFEVELASASQIGEQRRKMPGFATRGGRYRLTLDTPLQRYRPPGLGRGWSVQWSQVWTATVEAVDDTTTTSGIDPERVVLKIIQPSLLPFPEERSPTPFSFTVFSSVLAKRENLAYVHNLRDLQGTVIPHYFGKIQVRVLCQ